MDGGAVGGQAVVRVVHARTVVGLVHPVRIRRVEVGDIRPHAVGLGLTLPVPDRTLHAHLEVVHPIPRGLRLHHVVVGHGGTFRGEAEHVVLGEFCAGLQPHAVTVHALIGAGRFGRHLGEQLRDGHRTVGGERRVDDVHTVDSRGLQLGRAERGGRGHLEAGGGGDAGAVVGERHRDGHGDGAADPAVQRDRAVRHVDTRAGRRVRAERERRAFRHRRGRAVRLQRELRRALQVRAGVAAHGRVQHVETLRVRLRDTERDGRLVARTVRVRDDDGAGDGRAVLSGGGREGDGAGGRVDDGRGLALIAAVLEGERDAVRRVGLAAVRGERGGDGRLRADDGVRRGVRDVVAHVLLRRGGRLVLICDDRADVQRRRLDSGLGVGDDADPVAFLHVDRTVLGEALRELFGGLLIDGQVVGRTERLVVAHQRQCDLLAGVVRVLTQVRFSDLVGERLERQHDGAGLRRLPRHGRGQAVAGLVDQQAVRLLAVAGEFGEGAVDADTVVLVVHGVRPRAVVCGDGGPLAAGGRAALRLPVEVGDALLVVRDPIPRDALADRVLVGLVRAFGGEAQDVAIADRFGVGELRLVVLGVPVEAWEQGEQAVEHVRFGLGGPGVGGLAGLGVGDSVHGLVHALVGGHVGEQFLDGHRVLVGEGHVDDLGLVTGPGIGFGSGLVLGGGHRDGHHVAFHGAQIGPALDCVAEEVVLHRVVVEVGDDLAGVDRLRARDRTVAVERGFLAGARMLGAALEGGCRSRTGARKHCGHVVGLDGVGVGGGLVRVVDVHVVVVRLAAVLAAAVPGLRLLRVGRVDEDVVLEQGLRVGTLSQHLAVGVHVDGVVVDVVAGAVRRQVEHALTVVLRDIVSERGVNRVPVADHQRGEAVAVRVVVLVQRAVAVVGVPRLAVAVAVLGVEVVVHLVVLEHWILATPRPDAGRHASAVGAGLRVVLRVDVLRDAVAHIVFDDRAVAVHQGDGVAAGALDVVVLDAHVGGTVLRDEGVVDGAVAVVRVDVVEVGGVADGDAPTIHVLDGAVSDGDVVEA